MNQEERQFIYELSRRRRQIFESLKESRYLTILTKYIIDTYSDSAHFIYELIQNADDAMATKIRIKLEKDCVIIKHNGKIPFTISNPLTEDTDESIGHVNAITTIAQSPEQENETIGQFGIGFKSVFQYTTEPEIYNVNINFKIKDFIVPELIEDNRRFIILPDNETTIFYLPFNNPNKPMAVAYDETVEKIRGLSNPLLFLNNIKEISWNINNVEGKFVKQESNGLDILPNITLFTSILDDNKYLKFVKKIQINNNQHKIALCYPTINNKIRKFKDDFFTTKYAYCFFPTKDETMLDVIIHAPFILTPNREGIKTNKENTVLINELSTLFSETLFILRDKMLIDEDFYWILPYIQYNFSLNKFRSLYNYVQNSLQNESLIYTQDKRYVRKESAYFIEGQELINLLIETNLISKITKDENAGIVFTSVTKNQELKYSFIKTLINKEINPEMFVKLLTEDILTTLNDDVLIKIYLYLKGRPGIYDLLRKSNIIKSVDQKFYKPSELFFPFSDTETLSKDTKVIINSILSNEDLPKFFQILGVKEFSLKDKVDYILKNNFQDKVLSLQRAESHLKDIDLFLLYYKQTNDLLIFENKNIIYDCNNKLQKFDHLFIDVPKKSTKLSCLYYFNNNFAEHDNFTIESLNRHYLENSNINQRFKKNINLMYMRLNDFDMFVEFLDKLKVQSSLEIDEIRVEQGRNSSKINKEIRTNIKNYISKDYVIFNLETLIQKLDRYYIDFAFLLWDMMCKYDKDTFKKISSAKYQPNGKFPLVEYDSTLIQILRNSNWIPTKSGEFKKPFDCSRDELLEGFPYNDTNGWLSKIDFGKGAEKKSEIYKQDEAYATKYNTKPEILDEFKNFTIEEQEEMVKEAKRKKDKELLGDNEDDEYIDEFPEGESSNPTGREIKVKTLYEEAEKIIYEERKRSVRIKNYNGKIIKENLKTYYNSFGKIYCQICEEPMSIKYNGNYYYEAVQIFDTAIIKKENVINYLCLCSSCSDLFSLAKNGIDFNELKECLLNVDLDTIKEGIRVELNVKNSKVEPTPKTLRFVEKHLIDIQSILDAEDK